MKANLPPIIAKVTALLKDLDDDERREVLVELPFCYYCGGEEPTGSCYCMRDD